MQRGIVCLGNTSNTKILGCNTNRFENSSIKNFLNEKGYYCILIAVSLVGKNTSSSNGGYINGKRAGEDDFLFLKISSDPACAAREKN